MSGTGPSSRPTLAFLSTVHPHPWASGKGSFNRRLLASLHAHLDVRAVVPVPWTERRGAIQRIDPGYPVTFATFRYLPRVAPLALAQQLDWSLRRVLRAMPAPDVILGYWSDPDGTVAVRWGQRIKAPVALLVGGSDVMLLAASGARRRRILATLRAAHHVFTIGRRIAEVLGDAGVPSDRMSVFARGVDHRQFHPGDRHAARQHLGLPPTRPVLLWVGRMVPVKALDVLLAALADPALRNRAPLLLLAGDGPERPALMRQAASLGVTDSLRWLGQTPNEALPELYRAADLVVLPSRSEGVPNVLLEALACGTPFVATDVGSVSDLAVRPEACLVPPDRPELLAAQIAARLEVGWDRADWVAVPDAGEAAASLASQLSRIARH